MAITTGQTSEVDTVALARASLVLTPPVLAAALLLASQSAAIAAEQAANVVLGGIIGISFVLIVRAISGAIKPGDIDHARAGTRDQARRHVRAA
jgi:hypothetical protein